MTHAETINWTGPAADRASMVDFGIRLTGGGAHQSKTMMFGELDALLITGLRDSADLFHAVVEENALGKRTKTTRLLTFRHMASLYGLKTQPAITKTLISIWGADPSGRRLNALLVALARDPLLRDTASVIANAMVYIDWDCFETNQRHLTENARAFGMERRSGPVREGPALLQGRVLCGLCGARMGVRYNQEHGHTVPVYVCQETQVRRAEKICQTVPGKVVDAAIGALLLELMTPMNLEIVMTVQHELEARAAETDALRRQHVERTRYDAELARRRYMKVDPDNRLVADTLEAEWNEKLRLHTEAAADYEKRSKEQAAILDQEARRHILDLAARFPQIWQDPRVPAAERKRVLRLLVDDVTLIKAEQITAQVRLTGGATRTLVLDRPLPIAQIRKFKPELVAEVDGLLDQHCDREIAEILNSRGRRTWEGKPFNLKKIAFIRDAYKLPSRYERLRRGGMLTTGEVAQRFGVSETAVHKWGRDGLLKRCYKDTLNRGLWEVPPGQTILKGCGGRQARAARLTSITTPSTEQGAV